MRRPPFPIDRTSILLGLRCFVELLVQRLKLDEVAVDDDELFDIIYSFPDGPGRPMTFDRMMAALIRRGMDHKVDADTPARVRDEIHETIDLLVDSLEE